MSARDEILPSDNEIQTLISGVVLPTLQKIADDTMRRLVITPTLMQGSNEQRTFEPIKIGNASAEILSGAIRLRFREAFGNRILVHCECVFSREQAVEQCSGFSLKGEMKEGVVKRTAWTMRYSVWDWCGWV
jgi:hypothetical protein